MSILSDSDIKELMERSELGIEPFIEKNLTPNGYDLAMQERELWLLLERWMLVFMEL